MSFLDYAIFAGYMVGVLSVGAYHFWRNENAEDYYVGSRGVSAHHVGLSVVATDVGGGFSIGLGGVGFTMGLAGSWLLFTGLVGAWLSAVFIIPRLKRIDAKHGMMTYPDFLRHRYGASVALVAAVISGIGYLGFTGGQLLAGAKLASGTILPEAPWGIDPIVFALGVIAVVTIVYTVFGGLKAVIYTDTVQWVILLAGLIFVTIPVALYEVGGVAGLVDALPRSHFSLLNIRPVTFVNWMVTIIPIWLIGMTLYQRMYACKDEREAKRAWYIAGLFEYPVMAFTGVILGMCARVLFPDAEPEMGLPMLIRDVLPIGVTGIVIASYFSAIMSTADSCLMASSGNLVNDVLERYLWRDLSERATIRLSMGATAVIGITAVLLAAQFETVLSAILYAYAFMVSGLFVPTLGAYFWSRGSSAGALAGMLAGGTTTITLMVLALAFPDTLGTWELDFSVYGIGASFLCYAAFSLLVPDRSSATTSEVDVIESISGATVQHGQVNDRIYLMKLGNAEPESLIPRLENLAESREYGKIFAKVPEQKAEPFLAAGFVEEGRIPGFFHGTEEAVFLGRFLDEDRSRDPDEENLERILKLARHRQGEMEDSAAIPLGRIRPLEPPDAVSMVEIYDRVFPSYPFPIHDPDYLVKTMESHVDYFGVEVKGKLVSVSSAERNDAARNVEMTDFATLPEYRGSSLATFLLTEMEAAMREKGFETAYTIARAVSPGMNITFSKCGYEFGGRLVNNTNISGRIESMNIWYKPLCPNDA